MGWDRILLPGVALLAFCWLGGAQGMTLADAKAGQATQLSVGELRQLMPDARVVSRDGGNTRVWQNKVNGTLVASTDRWDGSSFGREVLNSAAQGTWGIGEEGSYCVSIQWSSETEDWCRYIFKLGDKYYGFTTLDKGAMGEEFEFSK
jgi:hypothetical protein